MINFKKQYTIHKALRHKEMLSEQVYGPKQLYWHVAHEKFDSFRQTSLPTFIARKATFFFEEHHEFDLRKNILGFEWIYAVKLSREQNIFNPKNPKDLSKATPLIDEYLRNSPKQEMLKYLWDNYAKTGYWKFIERDGDSRRPNELMIKVLKDNFDGFIIGSETSIGSMGIFNANDLIVQGPPMRIDKFLSVFDTDSAKKYNNMTLDPQIILDILHRAEDMRSDDEQALLAAMGFDKPDFLSSHK